MKTKKKTTKKKTVKKKSAAKPKTKTKVLIVRGREERPRMRDSVASGFGAGFGVAAGHEVGEWLFNPGRKGRRRNPERFQIGDSAYYSVFGPNVKNPKFFEKVKIVDIYNGHINLEYVNPRFWGISQYDPKNETLLTVEEFKRL